MVKIRDRQALEKVYSIVKRCRIFLTDNVFPTKDLHRYLNNWADRALSRYWVDVITRQPSILHDASTRLYYLRNFIVNVWCLWNSKRGGYSGCLLDDDRYWIKSISHKWDKVAAIDNFSDNYYYTRRIDKLCQYILFIAKLAVSFTTNYVN